MLQDNISSEVFTAVYSGVPVLEMTCRGVSVMRRRSDSALNATQILKVAGIQKGNRTKILEREILPGPHEKVQGGYGKYQGTWISYEIGLSLCERHQVREILAPLLELDTASAPAMHATPTKEQHQASVRRQQSVATDGHNKVGSGRDGRMLSEPLRLQARGPSAAALAALQSNRPESDSDRPSGNIQVKNLGSSFTSHELSQPLSKGLEAPTREWNGSHAFVNGLSKKPDIPTPAAVTINLEQNPLAPLDALTASDFERSREVMTNIFLESDHGKLPETLLNSTEPGLDIDVPIDELGHSALHWASALARLGLVQALIAHGAKPSRGNGAGETALMRSVMATNTMDSNSFLDLLDVLGSSLAMRDSAKRTVLHHIAITAGIKGRNAASRYYLTSLLEWVVNNDNQSGTTLATFGANVVNVQDRNGDTALNIAARIGNRGIVQSLLEVNADPYLANKAGIRPIDSGTVDERIYKISDQVSTVVQPERVAWNNTAVLQASGEVAAEITGLVTSLQEDFEEEMAEKCRTVEETNAQLREASKILADLRRQVDYSKQQLAKLDEISQRIRNTNNAIKTETREYNESQMGRAPPQFGETSDADAPFVVTSQTSVPGHVLEARIRAYKQDIDLLGVLAVKLNDKSSAMEARCRKLVSLCTNSPLDQVDETLGALLAALQSDGDPREFDLHEANRVAGFLKILA